MNEILPGIYHWTTAHPKIKIEVSSYYLVPERALLDPLIPAEGFNWFEPPPENIYLTNRHHYRHCAEFEKHFGCKVWCVEQGLHEFTNGETVRAFQFGDNLPGNIEAVEIGALCPDESALFISRDGGSIALADGVVRVDDGPLKFVPDFLLGDEPESVKAGLKAAYNKLLEREFDNLLLAHGWPIVGGGKAALREFVD